MFEHQLIGGDYTLQYIKNGEELRSIRPTFANLRRALADSVKYEGAILYRDGIEYNFGFSGRKVWIQERTDI